MPQFTAYPADATPTADDLVVVYDNASGSSKRVTLGAATINSSIDGRKLDPANQVFASWVPSATQSSNNVSYIDWGSGTATIAVPSWATKARVITTLTRIENVTAASASNFRVVIGADIGTAVRDDAITGEVKNLSWVDEITLTATGSLTLKVQAQRVAGTGAFQGNPNSRFAFLISFVA